MQMQNDFSNDINSFDSFFTSINSNQNYMRTTTVDVPFGSSSSTLSSDSESPVILSSNTLSICHLDIRVIEAGFRDLIEATKSR